VPCQEFGVLNLRTTLIADGKVHVTVPHARTETRTVKGRCHWGLRCNGSDGAGSGRGQRTVGRDGGHFVCCGFFLLGAVVKLSDQWGQHARRHYHRVESFVRH
jgi:hypothetical protein